MAQADLFNLTLESMKPVSVSAKVISLALISLFLLSITPASAATNLQVTVNRSNGAYLSASKTRMPNSTAEKTQISAAMKKYCYDYNYLGVIGDSGQFLRSNYIKATYKLTSTKRTETFYGTEVDIVFTCSYVTTLKNLGFSNSYVIVFSRDSFGAGSIKSPKYMAKEMIGANWRVSLKLNDVSDPVWTPKESQADAVFQASLGSEGCVDLYKGKTAKVILYDPSGYFKGLFSPMDYFINYKEILSINPVTLADFLRDDLPIYNETGPYSGWSSYSRGMYFSANKSVNAYGSIVVEKRKGFTTPERFLISVLISPNCEVLETINLGKF